MHSALWMQPWGWCGPQCKGVWHPSLKKKERKKGAGGSRVRGKVFNSETCSWSVGVPSISVFFQTSPFVLSSYSLYLESLDALSIYCPSPTLNIFLPFLSLRIPSCYLQICWLHYHMHGDLMWVSVGTSSHMGWVSAQREMGSRHLLQRALSAALTQLLCLAAPL